MLLTVKEVSKELKVNTNMVYRLINAGLLSSLKLGSRKVRKETLDEFLKEYDGKDVDEILESMESGKEKTA